MRKIDRDLHGAIKLADTEQCQALLARPRGPNVHLADDIGSTPIHQAAQVGSAGICRLLMGAGVKHDARDGGGWTPLLIASFNGHLDAVRFLLGAGADPNLPASVVVVTPIEAACRGQMNQVAICHALLEAGADPAGIAERCVKVNRPQMVEPILAKVRELQMNAHLPRDVTGAAPPQRRKISL